MKKIILSCFLFCLFFGVNCFAGDYIVMLNDNSKEQIFDEISSSSGITLFSDDNSPVEVISKKLNMILVSEEKAKELMAQGKTKFIEPDCKTELFDYDDTYYSNQSYYKTDEIEDLKSVSNRGKGVRVGLIDSGIYTEHEDFAGANIEIGYNFVNENTDTNDYDNHGTSTAGIIIAQDNNGKGIAGIAPEATIIPIVANSKGVGNVSHLVKSIMAAVDDYDCKIINMSLGTKSDNRNSMKEAVLYAVSKGVIIVAAVGNSGNEIIYYPACFDDVIGVGSVKNNEVVSGFSQRNNTVNITAQGEGVYAATNKGGYSSRNGTSFSAPIVTGMLTLLLSIDENITPQEMKELVQKSAVDIGETGYDTSYGDGIIKGNELYRAYLDKHTAFITVKHNGEKHTYKFYTGHSKKIYVYYAVFNKDVYKYGEYRVLDINENYISDAFEYRLEEGDIIKAVAFENFDTLKSYGLCEK